MDVDVIDLGAEHRELFAVCLDDWSDEAGEGGPARACWIDRYLDRGLRAKLARDDSGEVGGMIQYLPIEESFVEGTDLYLILCIWVHGHKQGRGDFQGKGMGASLLQAAEDDARNLGAGGMAAWGLALPIWMKASWFRKHGYRKADRQGIAQLLWKPFADEALPPRWYPPGTGLPEPVPGKVNVTAFTAQWCMASNVTTERARRAAAEFGDRAVFHEVDTSEPRAVAEWGRTDALFIDGKEVRTGPPPSYQKLRGLIAKRVRRLPA
jgi:GNAT superfamily N-acetyltransferase